MMNCSSCGAQLPPGTRYCPNCPAAPPTYYYATRSPIAVITGILPQRLFTTLHYYATRRRIAVIAAAALLMLLLIGGYMFALLRPVPDPTPNPYTHSGTLALSDPLSDNSQGHGWDVNPNCAFEGKAYHAIAPDPKYGDYCIAASTDFSNFVFEVQMKVIKGDQGAGAILFRVMDTYTYNQYYDFYVSQGGSYELDMVNDDPHGGTSKKMEGGSSRAINRGLNQTNLVAVVAQGSLIKVYINHQLITSVTDKTYSHGQIGVEADPFVKNGHSTVVVYSNAKVWTL